MTYSKEIEGAIDERMHPSVWSWDFLALGPILDRLRKFSKMVSVEKSKSVLDLGCGTKPYESLFRSAERYVGFDIEKNDRVDVVGKNWDLPFRDDEFDALISTQVLEHTAKLTETAAEIRRVVKDGGLVFLSVPFAYPVHGAPYDYYRFTKYGILEIFKGFTVIEMVSMNGYLNTMLRLMNIFLNYIPFSKYWLFPVFFLNNVLAIFSDRFFWICFGFFGKRGREVYDNVYMGMPENYVVVLRNKK
jgi:SAM-dependent methyltransferase